MSSHSSFNAPLLVPALFAVMYLRPERSVAGGENRAHLPRRAHVRMGGRSSHLGNDPPHQ